MDKKAFAVFFVYIEKQFVEWRGLNAGACVCCHLQIYYVGFHTFAAVLYVIHFPLADGETPLLHFLFVSYLMSIEMMRSTRTTI